MYLQLRPALFFRLPFYPDGQYSYIELNVISIYIDQQQQLLRDNCRKWQSKHSVYATLEVETIMKDGVG